MAHINLVFRSTFQGPKGPLNKGGFNASHVRCEVEVFCFAKKWFTKYVGPQARIPEYVIRDFTWQIDPQSACAQVGQHFEKQVSEWQMFEISPAPLNPLIPVGKGEVFQDQKNGLYYRYSKANVGLPGVEAPKTGELEL
jgi:hypothetical protein